MADAPESPSNALPRSPRSPHSPPALADTLVEAQERANHAVTITGRRLVNALHSADLGAIETATSDLALTLMQVSEVVATSVVETASGEGLSTCLGVPRKAPSQAGGGGAAPAPPHVPPPAAPPTAPPPPDPALAASSRGTQRSAEPAQGGAAAAAAPAAAPVRVGAAPVLPTMLTAVPGMVADALNNLILSETAHTMEPEQVRRTACLFRN